MSVEAYAFLWICGLNVFLKLSIADFISCFELPIVITFLLHCVVREMDYFVLEIFQFKLTRRSPNVPFIISESLRQSIYTRHEGVAPDVEFTLMNEQRTVYVLLDDNSVSFFVLVVVINKSAYFLNRTTDVDPLSSI